MNPSESTNNTFPSKGLSRPPWRVSLKRTLSWLAWRHRYLGMFIIIGFLSICLEVGIVLSLQALYGDSTLWGSGIGFIAGVAFAFLGNYYLNFRVEGQKFWRTLAFFAGISLFSYSINIYANTYLHFISWKSYPAARFLTSGFLFVIAYYLHRKLTFRLAAKNFGLAVYAAKSTDVVSMFKSVGEHCDHIHIDLVDESVKNGAEEIDVAVIKKARAFWTWQPFMIHIMSKTPRRWVGACIEDVDVVLVHIDSEDNIYQILAECRLKQKKAGVVAHHSVDLANLIPFLPHVDYVLVLGIDKPGHSGQSLMPQALHMAHALAMLSRRYNYKLIFDGGVTVHNVNDIPAEYIISSSAVLRNENPVRACLALMTGVNHD
jgi:pentose-5-phosphate-3-epimerase/putative flippase GtrA